MVFLNGSDVVARALASSVDLAIFDYMLPGRTGLELIHDFKSHDQLKHIPIIVVTAHGKESLQSELRLAGALEIFSKPFSPTTLTHKIQEILKSNV